MIENDSEAIAIIIGKQPLATIISWLEITESKFLNDMDTRS